MEDMDLSLRAYIRGWKAIFLDDVTCLNEASACARGGGRPGQQGALCQRGAEMRRKGTGNRARGCQPPPSRAVSFPNCPSPSFPSFPQLPASFFAYRKQQHRWTCGPIQLWSKAAKDIKASKLPALRSAPAPAPAPLLLGGAGGCWMYTWMSVLGATGDAAHSARCSQLRQSQRRPDLGLASRPAPPS